MRYKNEVYTFINKSNYKKSVGVYLLLIVILVITTLVNITSIFSLFFIQVMLYLYNKFVLKESIYKLLKVFYFFSLIMLIIYILQYFSYPLTMGLTSGRGTGADDVFFYSQAALEFPEFFPLDIYTYSKFETYSALLRLFASFFNLFYTNHPLDLLYINVAIATLVPFYTKKITCIIIKDYKVAEMSFKLTTICPFIWSHGLILLRDVLVTLLSLMIIYNLLREKYFKFYISVAMLFLIRTGSALIMIFPIAIIILIQMIIKKKIKYTKAVVLGLLLLISSIIGYLKLPDLLNYLAFKGYSGGIFRDGFISTLEKVSSQSQDGNSVYVMIARLPIMTRIIVSSFFYFISPIIGSVPLVVSGIWQPRNILLNIFYPIMFVALLPSFINGVYFSYIKNKYFFWIIVIPYIFLIILLSNLSMQLRHKTQIMPLFYIISSYGYISKSSVYKICIFLSTLFLLLQLIYNIIL